MRRLPLRRRLQRDGKAVHRWQSLLHRQHLRRCSLPRMPRFAVGLQLVCGLLPGNLRGGDVCVCCGRRCLHSDRGLLYRRLPRRRVQMPAHGRDVRDGCRMLHRLAMQRRTVPRNRLQRARRVLCKRERLLWRCEVLGRKVLSVSGFHLQRRQRLLRRHDLLQRNLRTVPPGQRRVQFG